MDKYLPMSIYFLRKISCRIFSIKFCWRISELIRRIASKFGGEILIKDFDGDLNFVCYLSEHIGSQIFWFGYYSRGQLLYLDKNKILRPGMVFIDIGANQGEFTIFAAKRVKNGKVIAFEPVRETFKKLERNVSLNNFQNVKTFQKGAGDKYAKVKIFTSSKKFSDNTRHDGLSTIYSTSKRDKMIEEIEIGRLDDFLSQEKRIDIIKIDIEGAELPALMGAETIIKKFKPLLILEVAYETCQAAGYMPQVLLNYLEKLGYRFELILFNGNTEVFTVDKLKDYQNIVCIYKK